MAEGPTYIDVLPIPDRVTNGQLRVAVQMTPTPTKRPGGTIDPANWPSQIVGRVGSIGVWIAEIENGKPARPRWVGKFKPDIATILSAASADAGKTIVERANEKWREIFTDTPLVQAIARASAPDSTKGAKASAYERVNAAPVPAIESFLDGTYRASLAKSVERRLAAVQAFDSKGIGSAAPRPQPDVQPWDAIAERLDFGRAKAAIDAAKAARTAEAASLTSKISDAILGKPSALDIACADRCRFIENMPSDMDMLLAAAKSDDAALAFDRMVVDTIIAVGADADPDPMKNPPDEVEPGPAELALRKLSALLSYPTLAKYFGLCADILIPKDMLQAMGTGLLAVEHRGDGGAFGDAPDVDNIAWTAFACRARPGGLFFGPWEGPSPPRYHAYADGLLNLTHKVDGKPRFELGSEAALITLIKLGEKASSVSRAMAAGRMRRDDTKPLPDRTTKGIVLHDQFAAEANKDELAREERGGEDNVSYADQLCHGLRFDILITPTKKGKAAEWRPLMARRVSYSEEDVDPNFLNDRNVVALAYRDDAMAVGAREDQTGDRKAVLTELMQWAGGSLAVSSSQNENGAGPPPESDVGIGIDFDLPSVASDPGLRPPPLRYGREYRVRARLGLPLGCGMTFLDIEQAGGFDDQVFPPLPKPGKPLGGYAYKRFEAVGAPPVALPWDSPLVTDPDPPKSPPPPEPARKLQGGRTLEELVVRSGEADVRFLLPARVALDVAEQQGQFDDGHDDNRRAPEGAFEQEFKVALYGGEGRLPDARKGAVTWYDSDADEFYAEPPGAIGSDAIKGAQSRGEILVADPRAVKRQRERYDSDPAKDPQPRYYPDRFARRAIARFLTAPGHSPAAGTKTIEFWGERAAPRDALPAVIELKAGPEHQKPARFTGSSTVGIQPPQTNKAVELPNLTITLRPAEVVDLEVFADCNEPGFALSHHGRCIVQDLAKGNGAKAIRAIGAAPLHQVTFSRKLRLIHAVERPIRRPGLVKVEAISMTVRPEGSTTTGLKTWAEHVAEGTAASQEGGATTLFVGTLTAEPRSSGQLRLDARWYGYGPDTIKRNPLDGRWIEDVPDEFAQLFKIDVQPGEATVNLLREPAADDNGKLRALGYAFKDGRARNLRLRPVATSRFTAYFPPEDMLQDLDEVGRYENAANNFRNAPDIWVDCTFRPPPPTVDRALPVFLWGYERKSRNHFTFSRKSLIRIFLQPDWYASGEGEQLAIVFDKVERAVCDYDDTGKYAPFGRFVTRWGRDAIRTTAAVTSLRPQNIIRAGKENEVTVGVPGKLHPGASDSPTAANIEPLDVLVVPLRPELDPELGLYCDIELGVPRGKPDQFLPSYMPFVQLGLARYQEHAVNGLQLSRPIEHTGQLLPYRFGEVRVVGPSTVRVTLKGQNYRYAESDLGPRLDVRVLVREKLDINGPSTPGEYGWFPAVLNGKEVVERDKAPDVEGDAIFWDLEIDLPTRRSEAQYAILIEEYEWLRGDPEDPDFVASRDNLSAGTVKTRRGPLFATTIDIGR
jgi:hypothetical protein